MRVAFVTDTGRMRSQNQDAVFVSEKAMGPLPNLFLIADGMGGHNAGEYASENTISIVKEAVSDCEGADVESVIQRGITIANERLFAEAAADQSKYGMGTTLVAASYDKDMLHVANVGDSRLYVLTEGRLVQVTRDHSVVEEMVRKGEMPKEEAAKHPKRNLITRAIGVEENVLVDFFQVETSMIDAVLLCTDGLVTMVEETTLVEILTEDISVEDKVTKMVDKANENGGRDNITVIVIESLFDEVKVC